MLSLPHKPSGSNGRTSLTGGEQQNKSQLGPLSGLAHRIGPRVRIVWILTQLGFLALKPVALQVARRRGPFFLEANVRYQLFQTSVWSFRDPAVFRRSDAMFDASLRHHSFRVAAVLSVLGLVICHESDDPHFPPTCDMSHRSEPEPSNFTTLFESALEEYAKQTGKPWAEHPLAQKLEHCDSLESVSDVFQE
ncbi:hypothetical protein BC826DRAFT_689832 [Russula brevipes]|nr:hypothetical protein BC826DRAFT_689832 [Russula brevipes]